MVLATVIRRRLHKQKNARVLMLGLDNAGKTTILRKILNEDIEDVGPSVNFEIRSLRMKDVLLHIWDVGGQSTIRQYWDNYFEETQAIIWVIDSASPDRFAECKRVIHEILGEPRLREAIVLVFANKHDLPDAIPGEELRKELNIEQDYVKKHKLFFVECSAVSGDGVEHGFNLLFDHLCKVMRWVE